MPNPQHFSEFVPSNPKPLRATLMITATASAIQRASYLLLMVILIGACSQDRAVEKYGMPYSRMTEEFIPFRVEPPKDPDASLEDLALSLPIFESSPVKVGDEYGPTYQNGGTTWKLEGDGAQIPVQVDRLNLEKIFPTQIRVTLGSAGLYAPDEVWIYTLERKKDGWKKLSSRTHNLNSSH